MAAFPQAGLLAACVAVPIDVRSAVSALTGPVSGSREAAAH